MTSQAVAPVLVCGLDQGEVAEVLGHIAELGYQLPLVAERHDPTTHHPVETDAALHGLIDHLRSVTPLRKLNSIEAYEFWRKLSSGRQLMQSIKHHSGLRTTEAPYANVKALGAGTSSPTRRL